MSFATAEAARCLASNLRTVLQHGGFRLTKFVSNNPAALTTLPEEDIEIIQNTTKVLGQTWSLSNDTFTAPTPKTIDPPQTLRQLFSMVSSIFDPIGMLAPFVIQLKVIFQNLWKRGQTWDQPVPDNPIANLASTSWPRNTPQWLTSPYRVKCHLCSPLQNFTFSQTLPSPHFPSLYSHVNRRLTPLPLVSFSIFARAVWLPSSNAVFQNWTSKPPF